MEETISLKEIFQTLRKRISLIVTITILAVAVSALVTYFLMTPKYDASTQILVNQANTNSSQLYQQNAVQTNVQLVNTYSVIIDNPSVLNPVINRLHLKMTADQLKGLLTVNTVQNSQVFTLTAETGSPSQAVQIVNGVAASFKSQVQKVMNVNNVSILSPATVSANSAPVSPKPKTNLAIGFVVGLMISVGLAFLLEYLDSTIKTEEDIEQTLGLPVLGAISEMSAHKDKSSGSAHSHASSNHHERRAHHADTPKQSSL